ncbi:MAG: ribosome small subunit-dependent GTPase A [Hydrogenophilales bacterium 16-64-46]|nr:MAG: ribosome small subunit-dependent GTPase A [Hydrogenophilales bacterium 12-64-13]OYZ04787.1 MAG: ribosome small subunit-dependent GTPase A [Hydrogenophilales bacterium 16-64-46]OZA38473.1 MAG: ribosome small subunit-dependent GTPase A [Hydrogenophilales bacterium 17-64-34]HQT00122.1 ribosome small subunit-dependent GTPase A [Thiobacillus sp.]
MNEQAGRHEAGQVVAAFSRRFIVETATGPLPCQVKGRHLQVVCGDRVELHRDGDAGVIEAVLPRRSLFYRSDAFKTKAIAANVTQLAVVVAARPSFSPELVQRCLLAAEDQEIASLLVLNKTDLPETPAARARLEALVRIGYPVVELSALSDAAPLRPLLAGHATLMIGQSGMGKSTLVNALCPEAQVATAEYSEALDSGRHTTTHTRLHRLDAESALLDSPGLQEFALQHLDADALAHAFVDFRPYLGQCRFRDCQHEREPGCKLIEAVEAGGLDAARLDLFRFLRRTQHRAAQRL